MAYMRKDVNSILLFLVMLTCTALVALTVVFAYQFESMNSEIVDTSSKLDATSKELNFKASKLTDMERIYSERISSSATVVASLRNS